MARSNPSEPLDPAYKYIDGKVKLLKKELSLLENSLLETQRFMARLSVGYTSSNVVTAARRQNPRIAKEVFTQLTADVAAARTQANASKEPLVIARQFGEKCYERAENWGFKFIELS